MRTASSARVQPIRHAISIIAAALLTAGCTGDSSSETPGQRGSQAASGAARSYECDQLITVAEIDRIYGAAGTERTTDMTGEGEYAGRTQCGHSHPGNFALRIDVFSGPDQLQFFEDVWDQAQLRNSSPLEGYASDGIIADAVADARQAVVRAKGLGIAVSAVDMEGLGRVDLDNLIREVLAIVVERI